MAQGENRTSNPSLSTQTFRPYGRDGSGQWHSTISPTHHLHLLVSTTHTRNYYYGFNVFFRGGGQREGTTFILLKLSNKIIKNGKLWNLNQTKIIMWVHIPKIAVCRSGIPLSTMANYSITLEGWKGQLLIESLTFCA